MDKLVQRVAREAQAQQLWQRGDTIVIACSGGPDSLALADILCQLRQSEELHLVLAHFEHGIRGEASLADADFVRAYARENNIAFFCASEDIPQRAKEQGLSVETAAREYRYRFLYKLAEEQGGALLATAHHADDQAETVLMRLLRGTGITGLAAMRPKQGKLIRPLLGIRREEIEAYCQARQLQPRQDETNLLPVYLRNRLRLELLPQLQREYNPQLVEALTQLAEIAAETDEHLTAEAEAWLKEHATVTPAEICLERNSFAVLSAALQAAVLRCYLAVFQLRDSLSFGELRRLRHFICRGETGASWSLHGGWRLILNYEQAVLRQPQAPAADMRQGRQLQVPGITEIPELGLRVRAEITDTMPQALSAKRIATDAALLPPPYELRTRRNGDSFALKGGRKKLKDFLIDIKLPREQRDLVPVFTAAGEIFWLGGLRQPYLAWVNEKTQKYLCFTIEKIAQQEEENAN